MSEVIESKQSTVKVSGIIRQYKFDNEVLPDPDPTMTNNEVLEFYSIRYPELVNGFIEKEVETDGVFTFEIGFTVGDKA